MIFLGLERPVEYGRLLIFDPTTANMVLNAQLNYVNAARDEYLRGLQDLKEFNKEYGDFVTPILADQDWYNKNVTGKVRDFINNAYANGIDLLRSPEGRFALAQLQNSIDTGAIAKLRSSRDAANEYLKNRGRLEAAGLYNPDLEERYLGYDLGNWSTLDSEDQIGKGIWSRTSPTEAKTLKELTESWYNNRTPEILNKEDVESFGQRFDKNYNYTGFADRHLLDIAANETPGWRGSLYADYYRDLAELKVASKGVPYTQEDVEKQLQQDVATANREYKALTKTADQFAILRQQHANQVALENLKYNHNVKLLGAKQGNGGKDKEMTSYGLTLLGRGIANFSGSTDPGLKGLKMAQSFGQSVAKFDPSAKHNAYLNFYSMPEAESTSAWVNRFHGDPSRTKDAATGGVNYVAQVDNKLLYSSSELTSNTLGYPGSAPMGHSKKNIAAGSSMIPTGRVYTAPMADGTYSQFVEVNVGNEDGSRNYWYKVAETEPVPMIANENNALSTDWNPIRQEIPIAPAGFSTIPSKGTVNQWSIQDAGLNKATGLAGDPVQQGQGTVLDYYGNIDPNYLINP